MGNTERSWNDPPMFLHNADGPPVGTSPLKRTPLNKRVAHTGLFTVDATAKENDKSEISEDKLPSSSNDQTGIPPLSCVPPPTGGTNVGSSGGVILFPPTTTAEVSKYVAPIIVPNMSPTEKEDLPIVGSPTATNPVTNAQINIESEEGMPNFDDDEQMFHYVMSKLQKTLLTVQSTLQPKVVEDVKKKLDILSGMWDSGSLSYPVKSGMARLATALHQNKCEEAHKIHMALMMDSVSEVGQWMVGVKRLIQEAKATFGSSTAVQEPDINKTNTPSIMQNADNQVPILLIPNTVTQESSSALSYQNIVQSDLTEKCDNGSASEFTKDSQEEENVTQ